MVLGSRSLGEGLLREGGLSFKVLMTMLGWF